MKNFKDWTKTEDPANLDINAWSGNYIPHIGDRVEVNFNGLGAGTITGFFSSGYWLGITVKPDNPPAWWIKQNRKSGIGPYEYTVFGAETKLIKERSNDNAS